MKSYQSKFGLVLLLILFSVEAFSQAKTSKENVALAKEKAAEAESLMEDVRFKKAAMKYSEAMKLDPSEPEYIAQRGSAFYNAELYDKAKEDFYVALGIDSTISVSYLGIAKYYLLFDPSHKAIDWGLDRAIVYSHSHEERKEILKIATTFHLKNGNYQLAQDHSSEAYRLDSEDLEIKVLRAEVLNEVGKPKAAVKLLEEVIDVEPNNLDYITHLGYMYNQVGKYQESAKLCDNGLKIDDRDPYLLANKSRALIGLDKLMNAEKLVDKSIKNDPSNAYAFYVKGLIAAKSKDDMAACRLFNKALDRSILDHDNSYKLIVKAIADNCR